jgi:MtN3 and saliva related transmembrane protein
LAQSATPAAWWLADTKTSGSLQRITVMLFALVFKCAFGTSALAERELATKRDWRQAMDVWSENVEIVAAACTTLCWLPQAAKIIREKRTEGISLITQSVFTFGVALWAAYGLLLNNRPILYANGVTLVFALAILILKVRYP